MNIKRAAQLLEQLVDFGVQTICLCPGGRNAPLVELLAKAKHSFEVLPFFDERSAGFFALGLSRNQRRPVAILTTSGTAVSELLSPVIEAFHSDTPLVVVSADRPRKVRGTGAPQVIDQTNLFKGFVEKSFDIEGDLPKIEWQKRSPLHVNICFDEPLIDLPAKDFVFGKPSIPTPPQRPGSRPNLQLNQSLVIVGGLNPEFRKPVLEFLEQIEVPFYCEALSGLKFQLQEHPYFLNCGDSIARHLLRSGQVKSLLRIGDVPVGRFWRDLEELSSLEVHHVSDKDLPGLSFGDLHRGLITTETFLKVQCLSWDCSLWLSQDKEQFKLQEDLLTRHEFSEVHFLNRLQRSLRGNDRVYLGNSLPVREWEIPRPGQAELFASRGVNGIDGQISTGFGFHKPDKNLWLVLGDLTALYDFSGLWLSQNWLKDKAPITLVVLNNQGGRIFSRMFQEELFVNQHNLNFKAYAEMWGLRYECLTDWREWVPKPDGLSLLEVQCSWENSQKFWLEYDRLWH